MREMLLKLKARGGGHFIFEAFVFKRGSASARADFPALSHVRVSCHDFSLCILSCHVLPCQFCVLRNFANLLFEQPRLSSGVRGKISPHPAHPGMKQALVVVMTRCATLVIQWHALLRVVQWHLVHPAVAHKLSLANSEVPAL